MPALEGGGFCFMGDACENTRALGTCAVAHSKELVGGMEMCLLLVSSWLVLNAAVTERPGGRIWQCAHERQAPWCPGTLAVIPLSHLGLAGSSRFLLAA